MLKPSHGSLPSSSPLPIPRSCMFCPHSCCCCPHPPTTRVITNHQIWKNCSLHTLHNKQISFKSQICTLHILSGMKCSLSSLCIRFPSNCKSCVLCLNTLHITTFLTVGNMCVLSLTNSVHLHGFFPTLKCAPVPREQSLVR